MPRRRSGRLLTVVALAAVVVGLTWSFRGVWLRSDIWSDPRARGAAAYDQRDWRTAEGLARSVLKADPADTVALRLLARAAARLNRDESAETLYRRLGTGPMQAEDYFLLGSSLLRRSRSGPALASLRAARDTDPDHAETLDALSHYWADSRSMTDAAIAAEQLRKQVGWEIIGGVRLARLRSELFDPEGAALLLEDSLNRDPSLTRAELDSASASRLLARCWLRAGRPARARSVLERLLAAGSDPEASWLLSRARLQEGKAAEAAQALAAAAALDTSDPMAPEPAPYVGAANCRVCHPREYQFQQSSPHARTLTRTAELPDVPWPEKTLADDNNPRANHRFRHANDRIEVVTQVGEQSYTALIEYALGSNHQGQSFLARDDNGQVRELRVSHYPTEPKWGRTMEHPAKLPEPGDYLGRPISSEAARKCLHCHSTNFQAVRKPVGRPESLDRGIGCERCHGPAGNHVRAVALHFSEPAINRPRLATAAQVVALCGQCHKAPDAATPDQPRSIRFQEPNILLSRCYTESRGAFSCVTCHDPHQKAERSARFYELKCLGCHGGPPTIAPTRDKASRAVASSCPVNPSRDCLSCHMPKVKDAIPRTVFTDHRIRIRRDDPPASTVATSQLTP